MDQLNRDTEILGESAAAQQLRRHLESAAASDAPVLVTGEPGTGRERVVRRIHALSGRSEEAFVKIPCSALDPAAARNALFGGESEPGRIALASRGSLFLDAPDRMKPALQRRLAAFIDDAEFMERDIRVLSSTGPDRSGLIEDLRQRIEVMVITVPPLRDRREDVSAMAVRFLKEIAQEYGRSQKSLSPDAIRALRAHAWPGTVRELRNLGARLVLTVEGERIEQGDLPEELGGAGAPSVDLYGDFESLKAAVTAFEKYHVGRALSLAEGRRAAAARRLGLSVKQLGERIRELGLS